MFKPINFFRLPHIVMMVIIGTLISRFGTAMIIPYVTVVMVKTKHLPLYWAGIALGGSYLAQALFIPMSGRLLEKISPFNLIKISNAVYALLFIFLGLISKFVSAKYGLICSFIIGFFCIGICRSLIETIGQLIISHFSAASQKNLAFSLRYTFINIGTSLGPPIALVLGVLNTNNAFFAAAICIFLYFILLHKTVRIHKSDIHFTHHNLFNTLKLFFLDKKLLFFVVASIFCYIGFSQMETLFAYIVTQETGKPHVFAVMYAINGITIIFLQMPLVRYVEKFDIHWAILSGIILMTIGILGVAFAATHPFSYYLSMIIFTLGEIFTLSLSGLYIDQLALPAYRYIYFGISNFTLLGRIIGPPLAGYLCHWFGLQFGLITVAGITLLAIPFVWSAKKVAPLGESQLHELGSKELAV